jgi:oligopeptide transport system ATP-binding protein
MRGIRGGRISMIFQDPMSSLNPLIPVGQQVAEMITAHQTLDRQALRERVLALFTGVKIPEPEKRLRAYPHEFSGGMRQRVMIAMALACNPSLMIADEPTTALDVTIQSQILNLLKSIQIETGMGIIFITHDLGVVAELCNRVAVMYGGMIMETASVDDLFERPAHPYTLGLLNSMPHMEMDKSQKLSPIPGSPPDMLHPPPGCPFAPRCSFVRNICLAKTPPYYHAGENHEAMCWLHDTNAPKSKEENPFG